MSKQFHVELWMWIYCSSWNNCSTSVQREGCTFNDLFIEVLHYSRWSQFKSNDVIQRRYMEAIDSVHHLCNNIEQGTIGRHTLLTALPSLSQPAHCLRDHSARAFIQYPSMSSETHADYGQLCECCNVVCDRWWSLSAMLSVNVARSSTTAMWLWISSLVFRRFYQLQVKNLCDS